MDIQKTATPYDNQQNTSDEDKINGHAKKSMT
jgi:hypothetical protein